MRSNSAGQAWVAVTRRRALPLVAIAAVGLAGCDALLDVSNPNNVKQEDLERPVAAAALVAGAAAQVADGVNTLVRSASSVSDETTWIGSQNAAQEHDLGLISDPVNEYNNSNFNQMSEGRWLADEAIRLLEGFDAEGTLEDRDLLAEAYLHGGVAYTYIADLFDDFVISDRREAAAPVGPANMATLYDTALGYLDRGLAIARESGNRTLELQLLAMSARAEYGKALWAKLNPQVDTADPLVSSPAAVADAAAALALVPTIDWRFQYQFTPTTISNSMTDWLTGRFEFRLSDTYAVPAADNKRTTAIRLMDPIDAVPSPVATATMNEYYALREFTPMTVVSARELRLILAEAALAEGDAAEAAAQINVIRAADGLTPFDPATQGVGALEMLKHMRRTNLLLMGRRLADQYRFNEPAAKWRSTSAAAASPGTFFPIGKDEVNANCHISGAC